MLLTITNSKPPATDLGYLLHKNQIASSRSSYRSGKPTCFIPKPPQIGARLLSYWMLSRWGRSHSAWACWRGGMLDEDVDPSDLRLNLRDHALHVGGDGHVSLNRDRLPSHPRDFGTHRIRGVGTLTVVNGDIGTSTSQRDGDCGSDFPAAASDKSSPLL